MNKFTRSLARLLARGYSAEAALMALYTAYKLTPEQISELTTIAREAI